MRTGGAADLEFPLRVAGPQRLPEEFDDDLRDRVRDMLLRSYRDEVEAGAFPPAT